jgi:hypothetical protein
MTLINELTPSGWNPRINGSAIRCGSGLPNIGIKTRLWPVRGYNIVVRGSNSWKGICTHLFDATLGRIEIGNNTSFVQAHLLSSLLDTSGASLGANVTCNSVKCVDSNGTLLAEISDITSGLTYLYRSIDNGDNWGNDLLANNNRPVMRVGWDGTTHIDQTYLLRGRTLLACTLGGKAAVVMGWYTIPAAGGEFNTNGIHISYDSGLTWKTIVMSDALTRHMHLVEQDPYTGWLWFGFGDSANATGIIGWDGVSEWPRGNITYSSLHNRPGFTVWHGNKRIRPLALWFTPTHVCWTADNAGLPAEETGFFKCPKSATHANVLQLAVQTSTINARYPNTAGGYGIVAPDGTWYAVEFQNTGSLRLTKEVYASWDYGDSWHHVANMETWQNPQTNSDIGVAGNYIWVSNQEFAGGTVYTYLYESRPGDIDRVEQIAPVRWVDKSHANAADANTAVVAANNMTQGFSPDYPHLSVSYPLTGNRGTPGMRVMVADGQYDQSRVDVLFNTNGRPGTASQQLQVTGYAQQNNVQIKATDSQSSLFRMMSGVTNFLLDVKELTAITATTVLLNEEATFSGKWTVIGCSANPDLVTTAAIVDLNGSGSEFSAVRSQLFPNGAGHGVLRRANCLPPKILSSVILGGTNGIRALNTGSLSAIVENSIITGQTGNTLRNEHVSGADNHFWVRNSYIARFGAGIGMQHVNPVTYTDQINYSVVYNEGSASGFNGTVNPNGIAYNADMFKFVADRDLGNTFDADGTSKTYTSNINIYGVVSDSLAIGPGF